MVLFYYTRFDRPLITAEWERLLAKVPPADQERIERHFRWQDRHARLLARLLLRKGLIGLGLDSNCLHHIEYTPFGKPYIESNPSCVVGKFDFSISHSGEYVLCAIAQDKPIGVDIEAIRPVDIEDFAQFFNPKEWQRIQQAPRPTHEFFRWWTLKESVIKADGRGLSASMTDIRIQSNQALLDNNRWFFNEINVATGYVCHLACSSETEEIHRRRIRFL